MAGNGQGPARRRLRGRGGGAGPAAWALPRGLQDGRSRSSSAPPCATRWRPIRRGSWRSRSGAWRRGSRG